MAERKRKAILIVSFGTTYRETRELTIEAIENLVKERFEEYEVRRAFTSHMIIKALMSKEGISVDTPEEALNRLWREGYEEVIVQSLHIMPGEEYDYVAKVVEEFDGRNLFKRIVLGRPVLHFKGDGDEIPDDYSIMAEAIKLQLPKKGAAVLMGHGTPHPANAAYPCFQMVLRDHNINNVFVGTVEGYPTLDNVINNLRKANIEDVTLMPMMVVAGDHCINDMASDEEDSWKTTLTNEGFKVSLYMHGLGENPLFKEIILKHIEDVLEDRYRGIGKTKKGALVWQS